MLKKSRKKLTTKTLIQITVAMIIVAIGYYYPNLDFNIKNNQEVQTLSYNLDEIPEYSGSPCIIINNNIPNFEKKYYTTNSFETYSKLDLKLGRCGVAFANVCKETMPADDEEREDITSIKPTGWRQKKYENIIDLCLDHHVTNDMEATYKYVDSESAAAGEIVLKLIDALGVEIDKHIANCLYTAIATDTGCFKYSNTTGDTLRAAARLLDLGCDSQMINYTFFELTTRKRVELEKYIYDTMEFCCGGKCAVIYITCDIVNKLQLTDDDMGGIESIPRRIEGVRLGLTIKEKAENLCKISARTNGDVSANEFCKNFGGGGHAAAAGCAINENIQKVREMIISKAEEVLNEGNC